MPELNYDPRARERAANITRPLDEKNVRRIPKRLNKPKWRECFSRRVPDAIGVHVVEILVVAFLEWVAAYEDEGGACEIPPDPQGAREPLREGSFSGAQGSLERDYRGVGER